MGKVIGRVGEKKKEEKVSPIIDNDDEGAIAKTSEKNYLDSIFSLRSAVSRVERYLINIVCH